jgi:hypothetical protein
MYLSKNINIKIYTTLILPIVLYGCKVSSPTLTSVNTFGVSENKVVKRIFGPKRERQEVKGWRKLHNEEHNNVQISPNIIRVIK